MKKKNTPPEKKLKKDLGNFGYSEGMRIRFGNENNPPALNGSFQKIGV
jgi:hypothetical protein